MSLLCTLQKTKTSKHAQRSSPHPFGRPTVPTSPAATTALAQEHNLVPTEPSCPWWQGQIQLCLPRPISPVCPSHWWLSREHSQCQGGCPNPCRRPKRKAARKWPVWNQLHRALRHNPKLSCFSCFNFYFKRKHLWWVYCSQLQGEKTPAGRKPRAVILKNTTATRFGS